jgi:hypothetical protein
VRTPQFVGQVACAQKEKFSAAAANSPAVSQSDLDRFGVRVALRHPPAQMFFYELETSQIPTPFPDNTVIYEPARSCVPSRFIDDVFFDPFPLNNHIRDRVTGFVGGGCHVLAYK